MAREAYECVIELKIIQGRDVTPSSFFSQVKLICFRCDVLENSFQYKMVV
jgi:hypothetical protein